MKTIGLIGGMSWQSSKVYYEYINQKVNEIMGKSHSAKSVMVSVDFDVIERLSFEGRWDDIGLEMVKAARQLEMAGADLIVLCTNTIHMVSDAIQQSTDLPFIHIADTTGQAIVDRNMTSVGLLGTAFTMEKEFYKDHISKKYGIEIQVPDKSDRKVVHEIIYNELVKGIFTTSSKSAVLEIMNKLVQKGAEGIIMGCTELPLLIPEGETELTTFDTTRIHADAAVAMALS